MTKTLVLYVFHLFNERVDFIMICNNKTTEYTVPSYVKKVARENIGYDFGGWSEGLLKDDLYKNYDHFIFVNSSVIGPFLPSYFKGKWTDVYIEPLRGKMKLFGTTINTMGKPLDKSHVQSYIFSMNIETLEFLIHHGIFSIKNFTVDLYDTVLHREIMMSRIIRNNGWNIGSLLPYYEGVDFTFKTKKPDDYKKPFLDDIMYDRYRNVLWNDYDLVFVKGNRITLDLEKLKDKHI